MAAGEIPGEERVAVLALAAVRDRQQREALVLGRVDDVKALSVGGVLVDLAILGLRRADLVEVDAMVLVDRRLLRLAFRRRRVAAVIEPVPVPGDPRNLDPFQRVGQGLLRRELHHLVFLPVGAALGDAIHGVLRVCRDGEGAQPDGAILRPLVRIDQDLRRTFEATLDVKDALVLRALVLAEEVVGAAPRG
jgi:hypothetical protein